MKNADKLPSEIINLANKLVNGTINTEEKEQLEAWYLNNATEIPVWELKNENKVQLRERLYQSISSKIEFVPSSRSKSLISFFAVAASIVIACGIGILLWLQTAQHDPIAKNITIVSNGLITKIHLPDHSIVWLKGNSKLEYPNKFSDSTRNVTLYGEALFEVAKDKTHPFVIKTGNYLARVLGTSFNIKESLETNSFKLTVLTGRVAIVSTNNQNNESAQPIIIAHGTEFEITGAKNKPRLMPAPIDEKVMILNGTEYDMNFENVAFSDVKNRVEKKFNVKINTGKTNYSNCFLSADVTDQSLENTLKVISAVVNSQYTINKNQIELIGGGCY
ncbi:FecR family protein [Pedobacter agri]|uniref:FecR family protein n=1 Tax=Pedobacter agri TaxID=454586 RepID=UPI00292F8456|nr:FecR family protein [Pedobacter agri]